MQTEPSARIRFLGFAVGTLLGISALLLAMHAAAVPRGTGTLGSDVTLIANSTGEIQVAAPGPFVRGAGLRPGDSAEGTLTLGNIAAGALDVSLQATPSISDLNDVLMIEIAAADGTIYKGTLGGLVEGSPALRVASGGSETLSFRVWLPADLTDGYQGRIDDVMVAFITRPAGGP